MILSGFLRLRVLGAQAQGIEGPSAVLVELPKILQALQTQIVHEAAEQVQRKVQRVRKLKTVTPPAEGIAAMELNTWPTTLPASIRAMIRE